MGGRIPALFLIFALAALGWAILSGVLIERTSQSGADAQAQLGSLWGPSQTQTAPQFTSGKGKGAIDLPIDASAITVALQLDQRRKGLLWFSTYKVAFDGTYRVVNHGIGNGVTFAFPFPADNAVYDGVQVLV